MARDWKTAVDKGLLFVSAYLSKEVFQNTEDEEVLIINVNVAILQEFARLRV